MKIGVITISDTRSFDDDLSGPAVVEALRGLGFSDFETIIVTDDATQIKHAIRQLTLSCAAVFTTGGTGFSPRDITPEATASLLDRRADNLSELIRLKGLDHTPFSHLSRGVAGVVDSSLVVNLPGSPHGARQGVEAIGHLIEPIVSNLRGEGCPIGPEGGA